MAIFSVPGVKIAGIAAVVPANRVSNHDIDLLLPKEREQLITATGIEYRRIAAPGVCTSDLCQDAAEKLITALKWNKQTIHVLIFVTQTPDYVTPATAVLLQQKLGLPKNCLAFDINLGCSGYVYGLSVISSLLSRMPGMRGLLLAGDVSSACISPKDKSTMPIFSDAGSATALEQVDGAPPMVYDLSSDGKGYEAIIIPDGGYRNPVTVESLTYHKVEAGVERNATHLVMTGIDVFNFAGKEVPANVNELLNVIQIDRKAIDHFVFHQANMVINESIRKKLQLEVGQVPYSLRDFGNTSSATIPVTMVTQLQQLNNKSAKLILSGFGVGLSWGSVYVNTGPVVCLPLIEV